MAESNGERTEKPTPRRLKELRKKNTVPRSQDLPAAVSLVALTLMLPSLAGALLTSLKAMMASTLAQAGTVDVHQALGLLGADLYTAVRSVLAPVLMVVAAAALTHMGFSRSKPNPAALKPQWAALSPKQGFKRMFSLNSVVEAAKGTAKLLAVGLVAYGAWKGGVQQLMAGTPSVETFASLIGGSVRSLMLRVAGIALVIGAADAVWQNRRYGKQAKMSKYEVRREYKSVEGDPLIKAQIRQRGRALARKAMVAAAADADVVVVNPTHIAVALAYTDGDLAPKVVAKGAGVIADRIRSVATDAGVPIRKDIPLARALHKSVDVGQWIPVEFYAAAAELLSAVFRERRKPGGQR